MTFIAVTEPSSADHRATTVGRVTGVAAGDGARAVAHADAIPAITATMTTCLSTPS
jgi:hypothetical protein